MQFYDYMSMITERNVHTLIAGCVGSGKSVLLNGVILYIHTIEGAGMYLIDPKRVELSQYRDSDHTVMYADTTESILSALASANAEMDRRFEDMQRRGLRTTDLPPRYIIIDELAQFNRRVNPKLAEGNELLSRITTLGRASKIFVIACTQRPTNDVITPLVKINCDCKIALRTSTDQESRNIIQTADAHYLPRWGKCLITHPDLVGFAEAPVRLYEDEEIEAFVYPNGHRANRLQVSNTRPQKPKSFLQRLFGN